MNGQRAPLAAYWRRLGAFLVDILLAGAVVGVSLLAVWVYGSWVAFPFAMAVGGAVFALAFALSKLAEFINLDLDLEEWVAKALALIVAIVAAPGCWVLWLVTLWQGQTPGKRRPLASRLWTWLPERRLAESGCPSGIWQPKGFGQSYSPQCSWTASS